MTKNAQILTFLKEISRLMGRQTKGVNTMNIMKKV